MNKIYTKTIKWFKHCDNFIKAFEKYKADNNLIEYPFWKSGFFSKANKDKKRVIIKAWCWHSDWNEPTKETYCYLIEI